MSGQCLGKVIPKVGQPLSGHSEGQPNGFAKPKQFWLILEFGGWLQNGRTDIYRQLFCFAVTSAWKTSAWNFKNFIFYLCVLELLILCLFNLLYHSESCKWCCSKRLLLDFGDNSTRMVWLQLLQFSSCLLMCSLPSSNVTMQFVVKRFSKPRTPTCILLKNGLLMWRPPSSTLTSLLRCA